MQGFSFGLLLNKSGFLKNKFHIPVRKGGWELLAVMEQPICHREPIFTEFGCCELRSSSCQELPSVGKVSAGFPASCSRNRPSRNTLEHPVCSPQNTSADRQVHSCLGMRILENQYQHLGFPFYKSVFLWSSLGRRFRHGLWVPDLCF